MLLLLLLLSILFFFPKYVSICLLTDRYYGVRNNDAIFDVGRACCSRCLLLLLLLSLSLLRSIYNNVSPAPPAERRERNDRFELQHRTRGQGEERERGGDESVNRRKWNYWIVDLSIYLTVGSNNSHNQNDDLR
jgi:hypothetical protein